MRIFLDANILFSAARADGAVRQLLALTEAAGQAAGGTHPSYGYAPSAEKRFSTRERRKVFRLMLHDHRKPVRSIKMDVFAY